jgi:hypothetical protein
MGRDELEALVRVLQAQLQTGSSSPAIGTWEIRFDKERRAFYFDKCEFGGYCEERPAIIALDGAVIDAGGPLLQV